jgi:predicted small metal-binding protein
MVTLSCKDLSLATCEFVAEADSEPLVENAMFEHIRDEHPELIAGVTAEQRRDLMRRMHLAVKPTLAA